MPRSILHIAVFTALALAAPTIASGAKANSLTLQYSGGVADSGQVISVSDRGGRAAGRGHRSAPHAVAPERGFRGHHGPRHGYGRHRVSPRHMTRFLLRHGARDMAHIGYRGRSYRIEATSRRGWRKVYIFSARSGEYLGSRRLYPVHRRGHGRGFGRGIGHAW